MNLLLQHLEETVAVIRQKTAEEYPVGIILGTGLGGLVKEITIEHDFDYAELPHFVTSTVESHHGRLLFGKIGGASVIAMQGRFHFYEGYTMQEITYPVRVMHMLGVKTLLVSNACGGMNPQYRRGDLMIMDDHINLLGDNPLIGKNIDELGPRFPDMSEPYSFRLIGIAETIALSHGIKTQRGVYVAVPGPNLETRAEYRFLRAIGADVVGMSTIPEVIAARHMNMEVFGMSIVTDECFPDKLSITTLEEILAAAGAAEPKLTAIMKELIQQV